MTAHSSIFSWRIPWTKEPGGLQSMGLQSQTRLSDWCFQKDSGHLSGTRALPKAPGPHPLPQSALPATVLQAGLTEPMWVKTRSYKRRSDFTWTSAPDLWRLWLGRGPGRPRLVSPTSWGSRTAHRDQGHGTGNPPWLESHMFSAADDLGLLDWICFLRKKVLVLFQESSSFVTV